MESWSLNSLSTVRQVLSEFRQCRLCILVWIVLVLRRTIVLMKFVLGLWLIKVLPTVLRLKSHDENSDIVNVWIIFFFFPLGLYLSTIVSLLFFKSYFNSIISSWEPFLCFLSPLTVSISGTLLCLLFSHSIYVSLSSFFSFSIVLYASCFP